MLVAARSLECWHRGNEYCWGHECSSVVFVVCCVGSGLCDELVHRILTGYVYLIACDLETSTVRRPRPHSGCCGTENIDIRGSKSYFYKNISLGCWLSWDSRRQEPIISFFWNDLKRMDSVKAGNLTASSVKRTVSEKALRHGPSFIGEGIQLLRPVLWKYSIHPKL